MRSVVIKIVISFIIVLATHLVLAFLANGTTDQYYQKFTLKSSPNLILGTSRASQGLNPVFFNDILEENDFQNFAFTLKSSSYGEVYFNAVKEKTKRIDSGGCFILSIDPWCISQEKGKTINSSDSSSVLFGINHFDQKPNFEYLWKKFPYGWGMIAFRNFEKFILKANYRYFNENVNGSFAQVAPDGYLRVYPSLDSLFVVKKEIRTFREYEKKTHQMVFSEERFYYLAKLIDLLKSKGEVYLVRLPVHKTMLEIEEDYLAGFNSHISTLLTKADGYFDLIEAPLDNVYIDGNHLYSESATKVSQYLATEIKRFRNADTY